MKLKNIASIVAIIIGIIALAAGVAVVVDKLLKKKANNFEGYIESDCTPENIEAAAEEI